MGLTLHSMEVIKSCLPAKRILSLGYPDIVVPCETIEQLFGISVSKTTDFGKWHGVKYRLPDTISLFNQMGSDIKCVDINASRGVEEIVDLNFPVDLGKFDLVIDAGTIEHCFHIGQAIINAASAVGPRGRIFHSNPMNSMNHGFYNLSPTIYWDFYKQNGWEIERFYAIDREQNIYNVPNLKRFLSKSEWNLLCVAQRTNFMPLSIPVQEKYRLHSDLH